MTGAAQAFDARDPFVGSGSVRETARAVDWSRTALGPVSNWSATLRTTVRACLDAPFPINLWCGEDLTCIYNDAYAGILRHKHPHSLGRPGHEVWSEFWDSIAPLFDQLRAGGPSIYAEDAPFASGGPVDGASREPDAWFTFSLSPVRDWRGEIVAYLNIVSNTTERVRADRHRAHALWQAERAEARLREVFTQAPSFLAVLRGPDLVFEYVNEAYYQLVGKRDLIGRSLLDALPEIEGQGFEQLVRTVFESGEPYVGREVPVLLARRPGLERERRFVDFVYYPVTEMEGHPTGVVAHGSDVSDHVAAREEALRARGEAMEANRAKSQFLATMSHEIRTPINAIMGYTDLLELGIAGPTTDTQKRHLERVRVSSQHLLMLVDDVLDLAKVEAGRLEFEYDRLMARTTLESALSLVQPQAAKREIRVECSFADGDIYYVGDPDRTRQILVNLLSNAVKFTPPGQQVRVECGSGEGSRGDVLRLTGPYTFFRVIDEGIGISMDELETIFRPFVQVDSGHTRAHGGTGLGLTISRELAYLMGGDLTVESEPGEGSAFTLWLPAAATFQPDTERSALRLVHAEHPPNMATLGTIIQENIRTLLRKFAERMRGDERLPGVATLPEPSLVDHMAAFVTDLAQSLLVLESDHSDPEYLLQDGSEIQRLIAKLHGRQRARLGWTAEALESEWEILREELENLIRDEARAGADLTEAMELVKRFLDRGERISRRTLRHASAHGGP